MPASKTKNGKWNWNPQLALLVEQQHPVSTHRHTDSSKPDPAVNGTCFKELYDAPNRARAQVVLPIALLNGNSIGNNNEENGKNICQVNHHNIQVYTISSCHTGVSLAACLRLYMTAWQYKKQKTAGMVNRPWSQVIMLALVMMIMKATRQTK